MILFFHRFDWRTHTRPRAECADPKVKSASRTTEYERRCKECQRILTEPWTDADRDKADQATRAYLANVEAGC